MKNKTLFSFPVATHTWGVVPVGFLNTLFPFFSTLPPFLPSLLPLSLAFIPNVFLKNLFWRIEVPHSGLNEVFGIYGFHFPVHMESSLQLSDSPTDCGVSLTFRSGLTTTVMRNFQPQERLHCTNEHLLTGGRWNNLALWGAFPLPSGPSQLWELFAFSGWQFQKNHSVFENGQEYILQGVPMLALVLTHFRDHCMYEKEKETGQSK